ncbi:hypothetical protein SK128_016884 [Halocaridina rubra]|uniref:Uncharacterized protein n=1 Tax=Halocaridina rubra TaxID=373956 RepID=A0AAN8XPL1_HALRR
MYSPLTPHTQLAAGKRLGENGSILCCLSLHFNCYTYIKLFSLSKACVSVQVPPIIGGVGGEAVFVDTEGSFSAGRTKGIFNLA